MKPFNFQIFTNVSLVAFLFFISAFIVIEVQGQEMSFEEYNPPSTLVVPENPIKRAKFPFIDIHSHQWNVSQERVNILVKEMDELNMGVMVNLSGRGRGAAGDIDGQEYMYSMIRRFNGVAPGRFIVFTNLSFREFGAPGWSAKGCGRSGKRCPKWCKRLENLQKSGFVYQRCQWGPCSYKPS
jgi:hypothetical protein